MPFFSSRQGFEYQEILSKPTFYDLNSNIRLSDFLIGSFFTGLATIGGFAFGKNARRPTAMYSAAISGVAAYLWCLQNSYGRLRGFKENSRELKKYGIEQKKLVKIVRHRRNPLDNPRNESK